MSVEIPVFKFTPDSLSDDNTIIVAPFQWNATPENTGPRLQYVANELGILVVAFSPLEALKEHKDNFPDSCDRLNDVVRGEFDPDSYVLTGWGDFMAGMFVAGMHNQSKGNVAHVPGMFRGGVLLRDSVNLNYPQNPPRGYTKVISYQVFDALQGKIHKLISGPKPEPILPETPQTSDMTSTKNKFLKGLHEMHLVSKVTRGSISYDETFRLASDPDLKIFIVGLSKGMSGSAGEFVSYAENMLQVREGKVQNGDDLHFRYQILPGWHSRLIEALLAKEQLQELRNMR